MEQEIVTVESDKDGYFYLCEWDGEPGVEWPPMMYARSRDRAKVEELAVKVNKGELEPWEIRTELDEEEEGA